MQAAQKIEIQQENSLDMESWLEEKKKRKPSIPPAPTSNEMAAHILQRNENERHDSQIERDLRLSEIEERIRLELMKTLEKENPDLDFQAGIQRYEEKCQESSIPFQALREFYHSEILEKVEVNFRRHLDLMVHIWGFQKDADSFWFEKTSESQKEKNLLPTEIDYWKKLENETLAILKIIFPGPVSNTTNLSKNKYGLISADSLLYNCSQTLPDSEKKYQRMIKAMIWLTTMHHVHMFFRGHHAPRGRAITKHFQRQIDRCPQIFAKINYLEDPDSGFVYNPDPQLVRTIGEKITEEIYREGHVLLIDRNNPNNAAENPLIHLGLPKDLTSAILKSLDDADFPLGNPPKMHDISRMFIHYPLEDSLNMKYRPANDRENKLLEQENYIEIYFDLCGTAFYHNEEIERLIFSSEYNNDEQNLLINIHRHYLELKENQQKKITKTLGKLFGFHGTTCNESKTKNGMRSKKVNDDSIGKFLRFKTVIDYRPTYDVIDIQDTVNELRGMITESEELFDTCTSFVRENQTKFLQNFFKAITKKIPKNWRFAAFLAKKVADIVFKNYSETINVHCDEGGLYLHLKSLYLSESSKPEHQGQKKFLQSLKKSLELMEELDEITRHCPEKPYLKITIGFRPKIASPDFTTDRAFQNFRNPGEDFPIEEQILHYPNSKQYEEDHKEYKKTKNMRIAEKYMLRDTTPLKLTEQSSTNPDGSARFEPIPYKEYLLKLISCFTKNYEFDFYDRTVPSKLKSTNLSTDYGKELSVRENCKLLILKAMANPENRNLLEELLADEKNAAEVAKFIELCLIDSCDPESQKYRRNRFQDTQLMTILSSSPQLIEVMIQIQGKNGESSIDREKQKTLSCFLAKQAAKRTHKIEKLKNALSPDSIRHYENLTLQRENPRLDFYHLIKFRERYGCNEKEAAKMLSGTKLLSLLDIFYPVINPDQELEDILSEPKDTKPGWKKVLKAQMEPYFNKPELDTLLKCITLRKIRQNDHNNPRHIAKIHKKTIQHLKNLSENDLVKVTATLRHHIKNCPATIQLEEKKTYKSLYHKLVKDYISKREKQLQVVLNNDDDAAKQINQISQCLGQTDGDENFLIKEEEIPIYAGP